MRIMIVDDSRTFREATKLLLKKNPIYKIVAEAENGEVAVELYKQYIPEMVLMDIEMPVMNGIEATKVIMREYKEAKIIAISAHKEKLYLNEALDAGFSGFVYKNNMIEQLHDAITFAT
ncbi:MAG: response regulator transcription factor [Chloroflexia bacterium]|nr:response regulator transcription factor [Chloroflexia bacterium]